MKHISSHCFVQTTLNIIADKWKVLIIYELISGIKRFSEIKRSLTGISSKVLTENLRFLEDQKIIKKKIYPTIPPKVEYSLSSVGKTLLPLLDSISDWGEKFSDLDSLGSTLKAK